MLSARRFLTSRIALVGQAGLIVTLICFYRLSKFLLNIMNPFYLDLGFSLTQVAEVRKIYGVAMLMFGVFIGGYAIARCGPDARHCWSAPSRRRSAATWAMPGLRPSASPNVPYPMLLALGFDNICDAFTGTRLLAYMSSLTSAG